jgi:gliding motility-associated-like protein
VVLTQCDDDTDGFSAFNLNEANNSISTNAANETFTFYLSPASAYLGDETSSDFIQNPTTYINQNVSTGIVWARVLSEFGCVSVSEVQLQVSTTNIPSTYQREFSVCDDFLDINGVDNDDNDDADGVSTFDFSSVTAEILAFIPLGQNPLPPRYYRNEADALAEENEILDISNYRNIGYPGSQRIYVRVDSALLNDCLGLGAHITLNVETVPIANSINIDRQCDDNYDGLYAFDTSQIEPILLNGQSLTDVTVTYIDENDNPLPSPLPNPFVTGSQTITIRVTNNVTADPNGACYDETTLEFIVDQLPIANAVEIPEVCDDDDQSDGTYSFNTSTIENEILSGQTGFEVYYFDSAGVELSSPLPNPFVTQSQTITAMVVNPLNENCFDIAELDFVVHTLPDFSIESTQIVCSSDPTFTVVLDPEESYSEQYAYEWLFEDGTILSNASTLSVSTPGTYTITLTKTDGSNCSRSRDVYVNASELATITQDDIIVHDISNNNTITIISENNNLGLGDYEFVLNNEYGIYQDEPYFEKVPAGIHTLYVRDKKGCGTTSIEISVVGHPKFFTPNGDGFNDTWQLKGVNDQFQSNSIIYVFNRYGKLLKQLSPSSMGWDGTFNGNRMPSDDYWFSVRLEDGRTYKGHFTLKR